MDLSATRKLKSIHIGGYELWLNARSLGLRRVLFWFSKFIYTKLFGLAQSLHSVSPFQGYTPADCFMLRARSLTLDSALPKIWLRFTIFTKLFHSVQFLTIRQSQLRIRCLRRNNNIFAFNSLFSICFNQQACALLPFFFFHPLAFIFIICYHNFVTNATCIF